MPQRTAKNVFINCPFDASYQPLFHALHFTVVACGFRVRCALEVDDGAQVRIDKIVKIIAESPFGIHDISRTELSPNGLPRFNMPLELGLFLGARQFGIGRQRSKVCLILDREKHRYQQFISDIAGQDIHAHGDDPRTLVSAVRDWLRGLVPDRPLSGGAAIYQYYLSFRQELPGLCDELSIQPTEMTYIDYENIVSVWTMNHPL